MASSALTPSTHSILLEISHDLKYFCCTKFMFAWLINLVSSSLKSIEHFAYYAVFILYNLGSITLDNWCFECGLMHGKVPYKNMCYSYFWEGESTQVYASTYSLWDRLLAQCSLWIWMASFYFQWINLDSFANTWNPINTVTFCDGVFGQSRFTSLF
jgi:hypothetical protein